MLTNIINNVSTLVVVGKWNIHVFSPEWVKANVFNGEEIQISISLPIGPFQFKGKSFELTVNDNRIHFELTSRDESARIDTVKALRVILRLLSQTPVTAFGINFIYDTDSDLGEFFHELNLNEATGNPFSGTTVKQEVKWSLYAPNNSTNIRLIELKPAYRFDVNYNYPVNDCHAIMTIIDDDDLISSKQAECEQLLQSLFNIKANE